MKLFLLSSIMEVRMIVLVRHFIATGATLLSGLSMAQGISASVDIQRNIEQSVEQLQKQNRAIKPLTQLDVLGLEQKESAHNLRVVQTGEGPLQQAIESYWAPHIGKAASTEDIQAFNGWLFDESRRIGYLSYALTRVEKGVEGDVLHVDIVRPTIHAVRVVSEYPELSSAYAQLVAKRLLKHVMPGQFLDTLGLDQRLDTASFDLPVDLDATVRAVAPDQVDVLIHLRPSFARKGELIQSFFQFNNYGLKSYGRSQLMGLFSIGGPAAKSSLNVLVQRSQGLTYGRAEYDFAHSPTQGHWRLWGAVSDSQSITAGSATNKGQNNEVGFGHLSQVSPGYRDYAFQESVDFIYRTSNTRLKSSGTVTSALRDRQIRFRERIDNSKISTDASYADFALTMGAYDQVINQDIERMYSKLNVDLQDQRSWGLQRRWFSVIRLKGQFNSGRLDAYNQIALGGVDGVRAFTSSDGVGDRGALLNLEFNRRLSNGTKIGAFYDVGSVRLLSPQSHEYGGRYSLQALGAQWSGTIDRLHFSAVVAKAVGNDRGWSPYNLESKPRQWRMYASLSYRF